MELPFAVGIHDSPIQGTALHHSDSSLVTASSQGSFVESGLFDSPLLPNTPQDVVLPNYHQSRTTAAATVATTTTTSSHPPPPLISGQFSDDTEVIDFTYVNISEEDADAGVLVEGGDVEVQQENQRGDILTILLSGMQHQRTDDLLTRTENANAAAANAMQAKKAGDLLAALEFHSQSANLYREIAVSIKDQNASLATSLLLLCQTQAKSALSLKGIVKLSAAELKQLFPSSDSDRKPNGATMVMSQKDRLRAAVRGALGSRHPHEADISDSQFLGGAVAEAHQPVSTRTMDDPTNVDDERGTLLWEGQEPNHNAVDEMMELERELRDMDMALELGNSISSLDTRIQSRMKSSVIDGSFMVVPPGSESYMSSSMWGNNNPLPRGGPSRVVSSSNLHSNTAATRTRNKVQTIQTTNRPAHPPLQLVSPPPSRNTAGLESSWWGNQSTASQVLTSSVISLGGPSGGNMGDVHGSQPTNTKQLMRLMDSLKALGDENAVLLREVEELESARSEAKAAREEMRKFKDEYRQRLDKLKEALKKYAQEYPKQADGITEHPVASSEFHKNSASADQLQRQEQLIRKLTADLKKEKEALKKEKEESKKKDQALRKYENFYREVKARSAQKAAQKTQQQRQHTAAPRKPKQVPPR